MPSVALFDLLPDFGTRSPRAGQPQAAAEPERKPDEAPPQADIGTLIAEAVADAETALEARLAVAHQAALDAERQANADEAKAFLESFGGDVGQAVARHIDAMELRVTDLVGATLARIIGGMVSDDLQKRSLDALARTIGEAIADSEAVRIAVRGPLSLFETLAASLGPRAAQLDFVEAQGLDLTVVIDEAVFETRIAEWSASLSEVLS
ncbi:hypothetical protein EN833_11420 [Mesorhizobium sp. M4B.F.Ca.ET.190.01.1.1]|uniref:Flagellar assembly protein FliH/Type III secretion system HrpE domain-containing protein n=2 Tax=Mesorhizobium TaxID=68287 RepID=A0ABU5AGF7_9HYPH|nr:MULTISPECIES: hypothetical protein [Mesorhizobium]MDX8536373.1 hypothetical protein [Mesorhizobium abyssinicae]TGQ41561.1 hypothetical protein EN857_07460 [Mesorhizobium sp. M4B.F.Ca.ET.214.01.1.1]TGQ61489.1 hypothetical protein EN854_07465 [Mesorhizobium sp. M4B.F.Ca.ET.211.01.1.1]TGR12082.1 hypothetical protein EN843_11415 [Mesorhizobium sp. M4B.F.Ca.ET.200.01.1.1]TGS20399.1 hypothetical protein EN833_11420 [Mesorhizobium sp. M4B.F.Ca.ET.190.01.1.1]